MAGILDLSKARFWSLGNKVAGIQTTFASYLENLLTL